MYKLDLGILLETELSIFEKNNGIGIKLGVVTAGHG